MNALNMQSQLDYIIKKLEETHKEYQELGLLLIILIRKI